jgi:hypothetical protein
LSRGRFKLMRADLQRHLLSAWILLLGWRLREVCQVWGLLRLLLLCVLVDHVIHKSLYSTSRCYDIREKLPSALWRFMPFQELFFHNITYSCRRLIEGVWVILLPFLCRICRNHISRGETCTVERLSSRELINLSLHHLEGVAWNLLLLLLATICRYIRLLFLSQAQWSSILRLCNLLSIAILDFRLWNFDYLLWIIELLLNDQGVNYLTRLAWSKAMLFLGWNLL